MKAFRTFVTGMLKGRITRWVTLTAAVALAGLLTVAASPGGNRQNKLGGAWIGEGPSHWTGLHIPLDPDGQAAIIRVNFFTLSEDWVGLLAAFGADTLTESVSQAEMISNDTAKFALVSYGTTKGHPQGFSVVLVMRGTLTFTGRDNLVVNCTVDVYPGPANTLGLPNADADGDGLPDKGTTPAYSIPATSAAKRVPLQ